MRTFPMTCVAPDCVKPVNVLKHRLCNAHYIRQSRFGSFRPEVPLYYQKGDLAERFWPRVNKDGPTFVPALGKCWLWTGATDASGYGILTFQHRNKRAHVAAYELDSGDVPQGRYICHHCDNRRCCRPSHLYLGTPKTNTRDMIERGRAGPQVGRIDVWRRQRQGATA